MIEILDIQAARVLGIKVSGRVEKDDIDSVIPIMKEKVATNDKINLYVEIDSFTGMSMEAMIEKFRYALFSITHVKKEAVVTDVSWMGTILDITAKLYHVYPGIDVKHFPMEKKEEALQWVMSD